MSIEQIRRSLPTDYAHVSCNFEIAPQKLNVGIVVPSFRREKYLHRCLESLQHSDLSGAVLCMVDETEAEVSNLELPGFTCLGDVDSPGGDITRLNTDLLSVYSQARAMPECVAFNELGWLKREVSPLSKFRQVCDCNFRFYVRDSVIEACPELLDFQFHTPGGNHDNAQLLQDFSPGVPVIRLFKKRHGHVHDSLLHGWDLLADMFDVPYFCNLDSDMIVRGNWLAELVHVYEVAAASHGQGMLVATAFNAVQHTVAESFKDYLVKNSAGGANFLFTKEVYRDTVRPALGSLSWDSEVVRGIQLKSGLVISTPRSLVQHIGARGMWSKPSAYDLASDY